MRRWRLTSCISKNSPIHTVRIVRDWFVEHPEVTLINCSAKSETSIPIGARGPFSANGGWDTKADVGEICS